MPRGSGCGCSARAASRSGSARRGEHRARRVPGEQLRLRTHTAVARGRGADIHAIGLQNPRLSVVSQTDIQVAQDALAVSLPLDGEGDLDAAKEIALHPVGARAIHLRIAAVLEVEDTRMLEETPDDRAHTDVLRHPGQARP